MECRHCGNTFSGWVTIEGKSRNLCSRKYCLECSPFGSKRTRPIGYITSIGNELTCTNCSRVYTYRGNSETLELCNTCCYRRINPKVACEMCGNLKDKKSKYCATCSKDIELKRVLAYTVADIKELYKNKTSLNVAAKIRGYGKSIYEKSNKPKYCVVCNYSTHYEVCHIRAVKDFPGTATMAEVHSLDNLIALCPNHHWEFDNGLLVLE